MRVTKTAIIEQEITDDIICNQCGESCKRSLSDDDEEFYGLIEAKICGGFLSDPLVDGRMYTFSLCEKCLHKLFKKFKIKTHIEKFFD